MALYNSIICRYNEIATKGNNRSMFENTLIRNMKRMTKDHVPGLNYVKMRGRIFIHKNEFEVFTDEEQKYLKERLKDCFGLDSFSFCIEGERTIEAVLDHIKNAVKPLFEEKIETLGRPVKFRTRARRSDKSFPLRSKEIEIETATMIEEMIGENKVQIDLMDPDISIGVEIREKNSTIFLETVKARGGLPVGSNSPLLGMLSGGIDSPVACAMAMKLGCRMDFLTFHSYPYTPIESVTKVWRIAKIINRFQPHGVLYACNLSEVQKLIRDNCDPKFRTVLYRRMMMRNASKLCRKHNRYVIVTGEAIGQVASQTVVHMSVIDRAVPDLIVRPLCGMDKLETIARAEDIGTFDISIEPMADSCTVFAPPSPVIHAKLHFVEFEESKSPNMDEAIQKAFDEIKLVTDDGLTDIPSHDTNN